ncbi:MAG: hypothetical protein HGA33_04780 [Candidatus Moranbacteria bacterium]|nr:hypothetical protein [Candidatus Moranbacteria bacterium]
MAGVSLIALALAGTAYAVGQNGNAGPGAGNQVQTQAANQEGTQAQAQTQKKLQDGTGTGNQVQSQNQVKNQDGTGQVQNKGQESTWVKSGNGSQVAEQRRSRVANAVQEMLHVADSNDGIGQQVKTIIQTQAQNQEKLETSLQKVESRGGFAKFLVGPDYGEINNAKKILEQNQEQSRQLNQIKNQFSNQGDAQNLTRQVQTLEQANLEIENSLSAAQKGFSLFGWMFRMFSN